MRSRAAALAPHVLAAAVGAVVAALAFGLWSAGHRTYTSSTTLQVLPVSGTGDPDRVIATQLAIIGSRSLHQQVASRLGGDGDFTLSAEQVRLSNIVAVTAESPAAATAQRAASAVAPAYGQRVASAPPVQVQVSVVDRATSGALSSSRVRDTVLAALGGAAVGLAALLTFFTARPRVRGSYATAPVEAVLLEMPHPGRRRSPRGHALAADLRRLGQHIAATRAADGRGGSTFQVSALPAVDRRAASWVAQALAGVEAPTTGAHLRLWDGMQRADRGDDPHQPAQSSTSLVTSRSAIVPEQDGVASTVSVVVARAWVDSEHALRTEVASRRVFSDVVVVVVGAPRPALVLPGSENLVPRHIAAPGERRRGRREYDGT